MKSLSPKDRILENIDIITESGCWIWMRAVDTYGYPSISVHGKMRIGTRIAYEVFNGPFDKSLDVCHRCDIPCCVNPEHLFLGTASANMIDCVSKGRHVQARKTHCIRGHKFTPENTYRHKKGRICKTCNKMDQTKRPAAPVRTIANPMPEDC